MIPIRLELKNFLPYRVPDPIKFEGIHLACLTGSNGAGKSSLLDAITWALWGKARATRDDDLIHQGQDHMMVQLDFEQENVMYRVLRRRARGKRSGTGSLDLFVFKEDGKLNGIREPSMRATQAKINDLLRLDYETFVHSAFLQQGRADAFTTQTPAQRKRILSDILGLDQWARYEDRVKEQLKEISNGLNYCDNRILEINEALAREPALKVELTEAMTLHQSAREALDQAQKRLEEIKTAPESLRNAKEKKGDRTGKLNSLRQDEVRVEAQIANQMKQIEDHQAVVDSREDIEAGYEALQSARNVDDSLSDKLGQLRGIDDERADLNSQLSAAKARLESEISNIEARIAEAEKLIAANPEDDLAEVQREVEALQALEVQRDTINEDDTKLKEERAERKGKIDALTNEGQALGARVAQLEASDAATCPLCGQALTEDHRRELLDELTVQVETMRESYRQNRERNQAISTIVKDNRTRLNALDLELKRLPALIERAGKLEAQVEAAHEAARRLEADQTRLDTIRKELDADAYAPEIREALGALETQQSDLGYDKTVHDDARQTLRDYRRYEELHTRLQIALESLPSLHEALETNQTYRATLVQSIVQVDEEIETIAGEIARLEVQVEEYNQRETEVRQQHTLERNAYERVVNAQQALNSLVAQAERKKELQARRENLRYEEGIYKELRTAFGKDGIPSLVIETAIPELEIIANELLGRMTNGRMSMRLTTQREKITGGTAETLEIEIADELGTRNYELYSGGEAFRINFALRVALSQLLARRAGAHLRTLFIDEGFGTQDEVGRDKLVEAITAIQDDFDLVLVITHIDELRDSFPVHVMVDKTASGSRISVR